MTDAMDQSSILLPEVVDKWMEYTEPLEGRVSHMYCDDHHPDALVTCADGNLCDPVGLALAIPWTTSDGSVASPAQIRAEFARVKALGGGRRPSYYDAPNALRLNDNAIKELVLKRLATNAEFIAKHYFPELASYPALVQRTIMSIAWACGPGFPASWHHFSAAIKAQNWACPRCVECETRAEFTAHRPSCLSAAAQCWIDGSHNAGVIPRDWDDVEALRSVAGAAGPLALG